MIISQISTLQCIVSELQQQNKTIVWTNGCFDIIHPWHIETFNFCKKHGDVLIVGINGDQSPYWKKKPWRPINAIHTRAIVLDNMKDVDFVYIFEEETPIIPIRTILPDILVKWWDYELSKIVGYSEIIKNGWKVFTIPIVSNYSTSSIIQKILHTYES